MFGTHFLLQDSVGVNNKDCIRTVVGDSEIAIYRYQGNSCRVSAAKKRRVHLTGQFSGPQGIYGIGRTVSTTICNRELLRGGQISNAVWQCGVDPEGRRIHLAD